MAARPVGTRHRRIASPKRPSNASDARIAPRLTNTPRVTSYGLDWPFTRKPREKKPAASSRRRSHVSSADDGVQRPSSDVPGGPLDHAQGSIGGRRTHRRFSSFRFAGESPYRGVAFGWGGGVEFGVRREVEIDHERFKRRAPALVIGALRVFGDLGHQPMTERVPRKVEPVDQGYRDRQGAGLPRGVEDEFAVVAGERLVVERGGACHSRCTPIIESRVTTAASCSSDRSAVPSGRMGRTR